MTYLACLQQTRKHHSPPTPCNWAARVWSTTRPSAFSVHKAPPSQSLHSPASSVYLTSAGKILQHTLTISNIFFKKTGISLRCRDIWSMNMKKMRTEHDKTSIFCEPQGPPADVWCSLHLKVGAQTCCLSVVKWLYKSPKKLTIVFGLMRHHVFSSHKNMGHWSCVPLR
jgi:hypothetical protein